jgi:hypothetical protein
LLTIERPSGKDVCSTNVGVSVREEGVHSTVGKILKFNRDIDSPEYRLSIPRMMARRAKALAGEVLGIGEWKSRWDDWRDYVKFFAENQPFEVGTIPGNNLLWEGINTFWQLAAGQGSQTPYSNANARIGVGDSSTTFSGGQTGLQASTNFLFKGMDTGFPTSGSNQRIRFQSTFVGSEANFAWNEFSVDNGDTANKNLNRAVTVQGTKTSGQTWVCAIEIELMTT